MPTKGTTPTQIRLTAHDKAKLETIKQAFGLPSLASAVRYSIVSTFNNHDCHPEGGSFRKTPKKSGKGA